MDTIDTIVAPLLERHGGKLPELTLWHASRTVEGKLHLDPQCGAGAAARSMHQWGQRLHSRDLKRLCRRCSQYSSVPPNIARDVADHIIIQVSGDLERQLNRSAKYGPGMWDNFYLIEEGLVAAASWGGDPVVCEELRRLYMKRDRVAGVDEIGAVLGFARAAKAGAFHDVPVHTEDLVALGTSPTEMAGLFRRIANSASHTGFTIEDSVAMAVDSFGISEPSLEHLPDRLQLNADDFASTTEWMTAEWYLRRDQAKKNMITSIHQGLANEAADPAIIVLTTYGTALDSALEGTDWVLGQVRLAESGVGGARLVALRRALFDFASKGTEELPGVTVVTTDRTDDAVLRRAAPEVLIIAATLFTDDPHVTVASALATAILVVT